MANISYILAVTILAIAWNVLVMPGMVAGTGLVVEPLWDESWNDTDACLVITTGNGTLFRGSASHSCNLNVTAAEQDLILLEIQEKKDSVRPSYIYVERVGELKKCPNKYVAFNDKMDPCSSVFIHRNLEIALQGNISVFIRGIPAMQTLRPCPEYELDTFRGEVSQTDECRNVKGYNNIISCNYYGNVCNMPIRSECDSILGPNKVVYKCNDGLNTSSVMIVYSFQIISLDLSWKKLIKLQPKSYQDLQVLQELDLRGNDLQTLGTNSFEGLSNLKGLNLKFNQLIILDFEVFNGLHSLLFLGLNNNKLSNLSVELFWDLNNLTYLYLNSNWLNSLPHKLFKNLVNLKTLNLAHNQITKLDEEIFIGLSNLEELRLNTNLLNSLPSTVFQDLISLQILNIAHNMISSLDNVLCCSSNKLDNDLSSLSERLFQNLINLEILDLSSNQFSKLDDRLFYNLKQLKELHLSKILVSSLPNGLLQDMTNLEELYLSGNHISALDEGLFLNLTRLKWLDLTGNMLSSLPKRLFYHLKNLEKLWLGWNQITNFDEGFIHGLVELTVLFLSNNMLNLLSERLFHDLTNLLWLCLDDNQITTFDERSFNDLKKLTWLDINNNMLRSLPDRLFFNLTNLENLGLRNNQISELTNGLFSGLRRLSTLYLNSNLLTSLPDGLFSGLNNLQWLFVGNNLINSLPDRLFSRLSSLESLYLDENLLTSLPDGLFSGLGSLSNLHLGDSLITLLPRGLFGELSNLEWLNLNGNLMTSLPAGLFNGLSSLYFLDLGENSLTSLPDGLLSGLSNLRELDLSSNLLTSLPDGIFQDVTRLTSLDLHNPLLSTLPKYYYRSFQNLTELEHLYLTVNQPSDQLYAFSASLFAMFKLLKNLYYLGVESNMTQEVFSKPELFEEFDNLSVLKLYLNKLDMLSAKMFTGLLQLTELVISGTRLTELPSGCFEKSVMLQKLNLTDNQLESLEEGTLQGLQNLYALFLRNNLLTHLDQELFKYNVNLIILDLAFNRLNEIPNMKYLITWVFIDLRNNPLTLISQDSFSFPPRKPVTKDFDLWFNDLQNSEVLVSQHEICECYVPDNITCTASGNRSPYLTCDRLLSAKVFVVIVWVIGLNGLLGNLYVLFWRRKTPEKNKVNSILLGNLAASDLLMGIYLLIIGSVDLHFGENFPMQAESWRTGITCRIAGALSITSSEASVFFVTLISIDRFICIRFPYSSKRLRGKSAVITVALIWGISLILGILPSMFSGTNFKFYDNSHVCIGLPLALIKLFSTFGKDEIIATNSGRYRFSYVSYTTQYDGLFNGLYFSSAVFLGLNFVCYLMIAGCYIEIMRSVRRSSKQAGRTRNMTEQIRLTTKVSAIVATDFCCWFPIIILGILVQTRVITLPASVFAWCVTFVLPINSAINPYLYTISEVISNYRKKRAENIKMQEILANQKQRSEIPNAAQSTNSTTYTNMLNVSSASEPRVHEPDSMTTQM